MSDPIKILRSALKRALRNIGKPIIRDAEVVERIEYVCRYPNNRACARLLLACLLAKLDRPEVDVRKPYTEIGDEDSFSGRSYDERYITHFINENNLPLNPTTAFLTPAFRNLDKPLTIDVELVGRPRALYKATLRLLDDVQTGRVRPGDMLAEIVRMLLAVRDERKRKIESLIGSRRDKGGKGLPLSSEQIVALVERHLEYKRSSRLPVLVVAAAYEPVRDRIGEHLLPLHGHMAADEQTKALGDVEICLENDDRIVTVYEMKARQVTINDIDRALAKVVSSGSLIDNYVFITTEKVPSEVRQYAMSCYNRTGGIEVAILDCVGFLRHFLHLFHRERMNFLNIYERLVLDEPDSSVSQDLKEAFLALRNAAESGKHL